MLGYDTTADYETEIRMAKNAATVANFYKKLRNQLFESRQKPRLERIACLAKRADLSDPEAGFDPWDFSYYYEKIKNNKYAVDSQEVQEYFPLQSVMDGLFRNHPALVRN